MKSFDFVILTDDRYVLPPTDQYTQNIYQEDNLLKEALEARGTKVGRVSWSDVDFDWASTNAVIFRTTWDYFGRYEEWVNWLEQLKHKTQMINPYNTVRWNMDKHYLAELAAKGIHIPTTVYVEKGEQLSLKEISQQRAWEIMIIKPCFSASARHTYKVTSENLDEHEALFAELISQEAMMVQEFQQDVIDRGEVSLMVMGGVFTHAVLKRAKSGDFRVQDDFGGTLEDYEPTPEEIEFSERAIAAVSPLPAYARVDLIRDNDGQLALIELELIEPELWFRRYPKAAQVLADHLTK